jgi:hypothetical protein
MREVYDNLMHAMQTGVKFLMEIVPTTVTHGECSPKHLRVGVNSALIDSAAVATLCMRKGIFTEEEYTAALVEFATNDVKSYTKKLEQLTGKKVTLV